MYCLLKRTVSHHRAADPIGFFAYASDRAATWLRKPRLEFIFCNFGTSLKPRETCLDEISLPENLASVAHRLIPSAFVQEIFTQKIVSIQLREPCMFAPAALFVFGRSHFISAHFDRDELIEKM
jgi:hypothetical protein